jgi:hypothetical protein
MLFISQVTYTLVLVYLHPSRLRLPMYVWWCVTRRVELSRCLSTSLVAALPGVCCICDLTAVRFCVTF